MIYLSRMGKTRKYKGGKFIRSGSYGCTFSPAFKCLTNASRQEGKISKLMSDTDVPGEMRAKQFLQPIDPTKQYFIWPDKNCFVNTPTITPENELDSCGLVGNSFAANLSNAKQILYEEGGVDLGHLELNVHQYVKFFKSLENLLEGLVLLHSKNMAHLDIKPGNLVTKVKPDGSFHTRFIDFGFLVKTFHYNRFDVPVANYKYWPYERRFTKHDFEKADIGNYSIKYFLNDVYWSDEESMPAWIRIDISKNTEDDNFDFFMSIKPRQKRMDYLLTSIDVYSLGIALWEIYSRFTGHMYMFQNPKPKDLSKPITIFPEVVFVDEIQKASPAIQQIHEELKTNLTQPFLIFLANMVDGSLRDRFTAEQALEGYRNLFPAFEKYLNAHFLQDALSVVEAAPIPLEESPAFRDIDPYVLAPSPEVNLSRVHPNLFPRATNGGKSKKKTQRKRR